MFIVYHVARGRGLTTLSASDILTPNIDVSELEDKKMEALQFSHQLSTTTEATLSRDSFCDTAINLEPHAREKTEDKS